MSSILGTNLKLARQKFGITQKQAARKFNVSTSTIGMYEQQRRNPDYQTLTSLCTKLDVSINDILGLNNENNIRSKELDVMLSELIDFISNQKNICFKGEKLSKQEIQNIVYVLKFLLKHK